MSDAALRGLPAQAELESRERELASLREACAVAERVAFARDVSAQAELRDLRANLRAWRARRSTRIMLQLAAAADIVVPRGTLRGQAAGYTRSAASLALGATVHLAKIAATPIVNARRGRPLDTGVARLRIDTTAPPARRGAFEPPSVSVIVPVYNAARADGDYLDAALESVASQDLPVFELIAVDDGSTDDSSAVVEAFMGAHPDLPMKLVRKENGGQSSARNRGAELAGGDWLAFLDQDDTWPPTHLRTVAPHLTDDVDVVYTDADIVDEDGVVVMPGIHARYGMGGRHPKTSLQDVLFDDICVMPGVTTIRRSTFELIGGFDERLSGCEDDDLFLRALQPGRVAYVPVSTLRWRQYAQNYGQSHRMIHSRLIYWHKLLSVYADGGRDAAVARRISLRFLNAFLCECAGRLDSDGPLTSEYLSAGQEVLRSLSVVDRAAFAFVGWAFRSHGRVAALARAWFLNGLESARSEPLDIDPDGTRAG